MRPYTVIFYIDTDKAVETFVEKVMANDASHAWDVAIWQARESGCSSSGHSIGDWEWDSATEIVTFEGHPTEARYFPARPKTWWRKLWESLPLTRS